jgi:plasmid stability protein
MKNVTVTLDEETARWARIEAARRDVSVSSLLREVLREHMGGRESYAGAMERYLARGSRTLGGSHPSREELHDRAGLR